jgi:hypothetical protein
MKYVSNLPAPDSKESIVCTYEGNGIYRVANSKGLEIHRMHSYVPEGLAEEIAILVRLVRNTGFEQGRSHVRRALGL